MLIEVRRNGDKILPATDWVLAKIVEVVNRPTGWVADLPVESPVVAAMLEAEDDADLIGLVFTDGVSGRQVPGVVSRVDFGSERGDTARIVGKLDTAVCNENVSFPDPTTPPWTASSHWTSTGDPVTVTAAFLTAQVGSGAAAGHQKFDTITAVGTAGGSVTFNARMQPVLDYIDEKASGLGVIVSGLIVGGESTLVVSATTDRPNAVFSPRLHTVTSYKSSTAEPGPNVAYAGGTGTGTSRTSAVTDISGGKWPRKRTTFHDRSNASGAELTAAAAEAVSVFEPFLELVAVDTPDLTYGVDYFLGDTCRVELAGSRQSAVVTAVETEASVSGTTRRITLGVDRFDPRFSSVRLLRQLTLKHGLTEAS